MTIKIAINGFGRIGRNVVRALYESQQEDVELVLVAINDLSETEASAHLFKYDSVHGRFKGDVRCEDEHLYINGNKIHMTKVKDPEQLPWEEYDVDIVLECSGFFATKDKASKHLKAGAKRVLISAPAGSDVRTVVYGVNQDTIEVSDKIVSNASCTTNCLAPLVKVLHGALGIKEGMMTTVHSYTNDQKLVDSTHSDIRRARSATQSMIPTKTGAAAAVGLVIPELNGKLDGYAIRVPTVNVSVVDFTFIAEKSASVKELNQLMRQASEGELKGILNYNDEPLVSVDFNHCSASSTFDATQTRVVGDLMKVVSWYDNEWGFSNRMLDTARAIAKVYKNEKHSELV